MRRRTQLKDAVKIFTYNSQLVTEPSRETYYNAQFNCLRRELGYWASTDLL